MNFVYEQDLVWRRPHDLGLEEARNGLECVLQPEIWDIRPTRSAALIVTRNLPARVNILPRFLLNDYFIFCQNCLPLPC